MGIRFSWYARPDALRVPHRLFGRIKSGSRVIDLLAAGMVISEGVWTRWYLSRGRHPRQAAMTIAAGFLCGIAPRGRRSAPQMDVNSQQRESRSE